MKPDERIDKTLAQKSYFARVRSEEIDDVDLEIAKRQATLLQKERNEEIKRRLDSESR